MIIICGQLNVYGRESQKFLIILRTMLQVSRGFCLAGIKQEISLFCHNSFLSYYFRWLNIKVLHV